MTLAVLYKYMNCTVDKLLALTLVTNYITNYSIIETTTTATATAATTTTTIITIIIIIIF